MGNSHPSLRRSIERGRWDDVRRILRSPPSDGEGGSSAIRERVRDKKYLIRNKYDNAGGSRRRRRRRRNYGRGGREDAAGTTANRNRFVQLTALHLACDRRAPPDVILLLLDACGGGAEAACSARSYPDGELPLHRAVRASSTRHHSSSSSGGGIPPRWRKWRRRKFVSERREVIAILLDAYPRAVRHPSSPSAGCGVGMRTPLHVACSDGIRAPPAIIRMLVECDDAITGGRLPGRGDARDGGGRTAGDYVRARGWWRGRSGSKWRRRVRGILLQRRAEPEYPPELEEGDYSEDGGDAEYETYSETATDDEATIDGCDDDDHHDRDDGDEDGMCVVCWDGRADHALVPCGHVCLCSRCAAGGDGDGDGQEGGPADGGILPLLGYRCPVCKGDVGQCMRVFRAGVADPCRERRAPRVGAGVGDEDGARSDVASMTSCSSSLSTSPRDECRREDNAPRSSPGGARRGRRPWNVSLLVPRWRRGGPGHDSSRGGTLECCDGRPSPHMDEIASDEVAPAIAEEVSSQVHRADASTTLVAGSRRGVERIRRPVAHSGTHRGAPTTTIAPNSIRGSKERRRRPHSENVTQTTNETVTNHPAEVVPRSKRASKQQKRIAASQTAAGMAMKSVPRTKHVAAQQEKRQQQKYMRKNNDAPPSANKTPKHLPSVRKSDSHKMAKLQKTPIRQDSRAPKKTVQVATISAPKSKDAVMGAQKPSSSKRLRPVPTVKKPTTLGPPAKHGVDPRKPTPRGSAAVSPTVKKPSPAVKVRKVGGDVEPRKGLAHIHIDTVSTVKNPTAIGNKSMMHAPQKHNHAAPTVTKPTKIGPALEHKVSKQPKTAVKPHIHQVAPAKITPPRPKGEHEVTKPRKNVPPKRIQAGPTVQMSTTADPKSNHAEVKTMQKSPVPSKTVPAVNTIRSRSPPGSIHGTSQPKQQQKPKWYTHRRRSSRHKVSAHRR